ncbi:transcription regulator hth arac- type [Lucifera butyrica]|uniref:Transcription regulator hth arac- type n=1 Tax=Lucifera butyrica TaxID=1351585 RepID=A0A498RA09_9FIRM|nr:AraC family transcriptional regulator [Lucifera butyrica]VBB07780.1 transcription regulator hth arac- type [Lucifera butyrica]
MSYIDDICKAIDYIETNFDCDIFLDDIASSVNLSKFHFLRIFSMLTGNTPTEYIRRRKLTMAASNLINTRDPIISIALSSGYMSQESFSRAFKNMYGLTPNTYRRNKVHFANLDAIRFTKDILDIKVTPKETKPIVIKKDGFSLLGIQYHVKNKDREIPKLWNRLALRIGEIENIASNNYYGLQIYSGKLKKTEEITYIASVEVKSAGTIPPGMVSIEIPPSKYAVYTIPSIIDDIPSVMKKIYTVWLPETGLTPTSNYDFELFTESFIPNNPNSEYHFYIPVTGECKHDQSNSC